MPPLSQGRGLDGVFPSHDLLHLTPPTHHLRTASYKIPPSFEYHDSNQEEKSTQIPRRASVSRGILGLTVSMNGYKNIPAIRLPLRASELEEADTAARDSRSSPTRPHRSSVCSVRKGIGPSAFVRQQDCTARAPPRDNIHTCIDP